MNKITLMRVSDLDGSNARFIVIARGLHGLVAYTKYVFYDEIVWC